MVTGHQIEVFSQFAKARIERGRVATSIFVLLDERQRENPPKEDQLSIEASLRDMEAGDAGQALGQFAAEFRDHNGLFGLCCPGKGLFQRGHYLGLLGGGVCCVRHFMTSAMIGARSAYPYTSDTSEEAERLQLELLRRMTPVERIGMMCRLSANMRRMAVNAIRRRHPEFNEHQVRMKFIEFAYGEELADAVRSHLQNRGRI